jgi:hypothetical protein
VTTLQNDDSKLIHVNRVLMTTVLVAAIIASGCGGKSPDAKRSSNDGTTGASKSGSRKTEKNSSSIHKSVNRTAKEKSSPSSIRKTPEPMKTVSKSPATKKPQPSPVYRPADTRPQHNAERLAKFGIRKYESKRLLLYTDIDPEIAATLPAYIDSAYKAWAEYFGKLPPARDRSKFQLTGYIMGDKSVFQRAGLIPGNLRPFNAGRHRGLEFWMNDQKWDYYRRHLMIHEATHCFMYTMRDTRFPVWYMEGMAELFGSHWTDEKGVTHFRVMPRSEKLTAGFGRIEYLKQDIKTGKGKSISEVQKLRAEDFLNNHSYGWSWALCQFLDGHPRHRKTFRALGKVLTSSQFVALSKRYFETQSPGLPFEWVMFSQGLSYGYDLDHAAIVGLDAKSKTIPVTGKTIDLATNRGWQSSGIRVEKGSTYNITATGRFTLAQTPKPWVSEPQGVSIRYFNSLPLGMLVTMIRSKTGSVSSPQLNPIHPIGKGTKFQPPISGTLYFRVNDDWSKLGDNTGTVRVKINAAGK